MYVPSQIVEDRGRRNTSQFKVCKTLRGEGGFLVILFGGIKDAESGLLNRSTDSMQLRFNIILISLNSPSASGLPRIRTECVDV